MRRIRLGLLGCGVVGGGLVDLVAKNHGLIVERCGLDIVITRALVRQLGKERSVPLTTDPAEVVSASDVDIVVEVMGGTTLARTYIEAALRAGKNVVTANKALLAQVGQELFKLAGTHGRCIGFEASVCAGLPVIGTLRQGLVGNQIESLLGIINGTTNYILTRMAEEGLSQAAAIAQAQKLGFCEADPSLDIDGIDAAQKLVVLAELAFGVHVDLADVRVEGIRQIGAADMQQAASLGYVIKNLALARRSEAGLALRVQSVLLEKTHPLANVRNEFNAVLLRGDAVGDMVLEGKGAGALPTASAVLSDIVDVALREKPAYARVLQQHQKTPDLPGRFYLRFPIVDQPGVIGFIATVLGTVGISISNAAALLSQAEGDHAGNVMILTHEAQEEALRQAVAQIGEHPAMRGNPVMLRIL